MKSKKILRIELRNPALRRIRKNFRDINKLVVTQKSIKFINKSYEFLKRSRESTNSAEKERLELQGSKFMEEGRHLSELLSKSIVQCGLGAACSSFKASVKHGFDPKDRPTDLDMVWMPILEAWFCTRCSENLIEGDKILREEKNPDYIRHLWEMSLLKEEDEDLCDFF